MQHYKELSAKKKAQQASKIPEVWKIDTARYEDVLNVMHVPQECGILTEAELTITSDFDATALVDQMHSGIYSVEQVTVAFCKRAAIAHQLTNCLTEIFFDKAIERARQLDQQYQQVEKEVLPPLFGLPVSLKDSFDVEGVDTSTGMGCFVDEPAKVNSAAAALLLDLGAVLYCKTNLPQSILTGDSHNFIFGRTLNPRNKNFTAGGSTGGEGALLALRGSILGIGTDLAGSIRVPAVCNGLYGFRPSVGLVPHNGVRDLTIPGMDGMLSTAGPMATSLRDCILLMSSVMQAETWKYDSTAVSIPWTNNLPKQKLRIGVVWTNGINTPSPPMRRGLRNVVDALGGSDDFDIIAVELPDIQKHIGDVIRCMASSGGDHFREQFNKTGEPVIPSLEATGLMSMPRADQQAMFDLNVRRTKAKEQYRQLFVDNRLDAIIMPGGPHTAVPHDSWSTVSYTGLWNFLDYPAMAMAVDHVRADDHVDALSNASGPDDEKVYRLYTGLEHYEGLPVCIQVVGYHQRDKALLNILERIEVVVNAS